MCQNLIGDQSRHFMEKEISARLLVVPLNMSEVMGYSLSISVVTSTVSVTSAFAVLGLLFAGRGNDAEILS
jgi:hypothetical protein